MYNPFVTTIQNRINRPSIADDRSLLIAYDTCLAKQTTIDQLNVIQANLANVLSGQNFRRSLGPHRLFLCPETRR